MKKKESLFEFPRILFIKFLEEFRTSDDQEFILVHENGNEKNIPCLWNSLGRKSAFEEPSIVLVVDKTKTEIKKVKLVLLSTLPNIKNGKVEELREYTSISVEKNEKMGNLTSMYLHINMPGKEIQIGNPLTKFVLEDFFDLIKSAKDLFESKEFEWITTY